MISADGIYAVLALVSFVCGIVVLGVVFCAGDERVRPELKEKTFGYGLILVVCVPSAVFVGGAVT